MTQIVHDMNGLKFDLSSPFGGDFGGETNDCSIYGFVSLDNADDLTDLSVDEEIEGRPDTHKKCFQNREESKARGFLIREYLEQGKCMFAYHTLAHLL